MDRPNCDAVASHVLSRTPFVSRGDVDILSLKLEAVPHGPAPSGEKATAEPMTVAIKDVPITLPNISARYFAASSAFT